jgi:XRE family aerobic/anaerobic benzoate catabolism transcriptional regulator
MSNRKAILADLGRRLRESRLRAGLSLTELAERAGVSRRYATDAEAGRANLSVLKLFDLARAAGIPLGDLLATPLAAKRSERIALVGLRGAGKSTVGRALALALEVPFVELDQRVEALAGTTLGEIFSTHGEERFHLLEREALEDVLAEGERVVIATGGSIVASQATFARLRETCRTVWLRAAPEEHYQRVLDQGDRRPMANHPRAMAELKSILAEREPAYVQCEIKVSTSGRSVEALIEAIRSRLAPS